MQNHFTTHSLEDFFKKFQVVKIASRTGFEFVCFQDKAIADNCLLVIKKLLQNSKDIEDLGLAIEISLPQHFTNPFRFRLYPKQRLALEKIFAQNVSAPSVTTHSAPAMVAPTATTPSASSSLMVQTIPAATQPTPIVQPATAIPPQIVSPVRLVPDLVQNPPLKKQYLLKSLRGDENSYTQWFFQMITKSPTMQATMPLRPHAKKAFTVMGHGVVERANKPPLFKPDDKKFFSKHCSTTLVTERVIPPVFGHQRANRADKLVGVIIDLDDALFNRMFIYDGGTVNRPYDFATRSDAENYYKNKFNANEPVLYNDRIKFEKAIATRTANGKTVYNEVLARLRWNLNGTSKIFIASDTLEARLLAQEYARLLLNRLRAQARENGAELHPDYFVPICFYLPGNAAKHGTNYDFVQQQQDIAEAHTIYHNPVACAAKYDVHDYEFLLALPRDANTLLKHKFNDEGVMQRILKEGLVHIVQSLLERSTDSAILDKIPIDSATLTPKMFYCVTQAGNVRLLRWLLAKRLPEPFPVSLDSAEHPTLAAACSRGHSEIVQMLLAANIYQLRLELVYHRLPVMIAADTNRWDIVKIFVDNLIQRHFRVVAALRMIILPEERELYINLFKLAAETAKPDEAVIASLVELLDYRSLRIKDLTPLHWAIVEKKTLLAKILIANGASVVEFYNSHNAIELAAKSANWELIQYIARNMHLTGNQHLQVLEALYENALI